MHTCMHAHLNVLAHTHKHLFIKEDRSGGSMISCPCPISWWKNSAFLQCDLFKEVCLYGLGRVELTSHAGHYPSSSSCPSFSRQSWSSSLGFLWGRLWILRVCVLPPASRGQHTAENWAVVPMGPFPVVSKVAFHVEVEKAGHCWQTVLWAKTSQKWEPWELWGHVEQSKDKWC